MAVRNNTTQQKKKNALRERSRRRTPLYRFNRGKLKAIERGKIFSLTFDEFIAMMNEPCYYCNDQLKDGGETGISLDRLDNEAGYWMKNVVPCCWTCNRIRNEVLTPEETKAAVKAILRVRNKQ